ncbi:MAG TPA: O-succinylhomoserine sulfhydrylase [Burkholderiales bacterium]|nr:O-succinylhomoserine sulfhydrylase [Burkholderiales bacterium]
MSDKFDFDTLAVRAGVQRSNFNENSEALYLSSSFVHEDAATAALRFSNQAPGYVYSRFSNPTVEMFQQRLAALEGGEACIATSSGMSAVLTVAMGLLKAGDHVVCSRSVFGAVITLFEKNLGRFGLETTFVEATDLSAWEKAVKPNTKMLFLETPSNPLMEVLDVAALSKIAKKAGAVLVVDNCFCSPAVQRPLDLGADIVVHSATKYLDGQGRILGGAIVGSKELVMGEVHGFLRTAGPSMSPFNAWVALKGMETLGIRMEKQCDNALELARWLESHPQVEKVFFPGLESHPQHELAKRQQSAGGRFLAGAVVTFTIKGGRAEAWRVVDGCKMISITANLGDTKSTITHPASTTHGRISPEARVAAGVVEGLLRVSVGLESVADIKRDLQNGLGA